MPRYAVELTAREVDAIVSAAALLGSVREDSLGPELDAEYRRDDEALRRVIAKAIAAGWRRERR